MILEPTSKAVAASLNAKANAVEEAKATPLAKPAVKGRSRADWIARLKKKLRAQAAKEAELRAQTAKEAAVAKEAKRERSPTPPWLEGKKKRHKPDLAVWKSVSFGFHPHPPPKAFSGTGTSGSSAFSGTGTRVRHPKPPSVAPPSHFICAECNGKSGVKKADAADLLCPQCDAMAMILQKIRNCRPRNEEHGKQILMSVAVLQYVVEDKIGDLSEASRLYVMQGLERAFKIVTMKEGVY